MSIGNIYASHCNRGIILNICTNFQDIIKTPSHGLLNTWPNIAPSRNRVVYVPGFHCCQFLHYASIFSYSAIYMSHNIITQMVRALCNPGIFDKMAEMTRSVYDSQMILLKVIPCLWTHISVKFYEYPACRCRDIHPRRIL